MGGWLVVIVGANKHRSLAFSEMFFVVMTNDDHILHSGIYYFGSENGNAFIGLVFFQDHIPLLCLLVLLSGEHLFGAKSKTNMDHGTKQTVKSSHG